MNTKNRKSLPENIFHSRSGFKRVKAALKRVVRHWLVLPAIISLGFALSLSLFWISASLAQGCSSFIMQMRTMENEKTGLQSPTGLAFSSSENAFYAIDKLAQGEATDIIKLSTFAHRVGSARIAAQIRNPINVAFDNKFNRLLILQHPNNQLLEVRADSNGNLDPQTLTRYDARRFGLQNPQGMTLDPVNGTLFILDADGPRIIRIEPGSNGTFDGAVTSEVNLQPSSLAAPRGLAFDPASDHLYLISAVEQKLVELSQIGNVISNYDLSQFKLGAPQGMVFAPSGDQTDDPSQINLYLADGDSGQILEFSLTESTSMAAAAAVTVQSSLIRTTNLASISPPSPDPSGLTYLPLSNTLLMSDGEVDEKVNNITHFAGANLWELTLNGGVVRTANISPVPPTVVPMSDEPTGVAWNPVNGHYYFSDDNAYKIFDLNPGIDGQYGSADDSWTSFGTLALGIGDPEGITFDTWHNQLFVLDGTNREVYQFTLTGSLVAHFDVAAYSVADPESIEFNPESGTLFILSSSSNPVVIETTTSGSLLQTIDVSANNAEAPAGLAYAPASDNSGAKHFYIVDRGVDNNTDPNIIDGKMYEMTVPSNNQPTVTINPSGTATRTFTPTATRIFTMTPTRTFTPTSTTTPTKTATRTNTPTLTAVGSPTITPSGTFTPTAASPSITPSSTFTATSTPVNTGFISPAMNAAQTGGDGNGYEVSAGSAYINDGIFARDNNSGTSTSSSCTSTGKDKHRFYNFNFTIPVSAAVKGIQIQLDAKADSTSGSPKFCVQLSWDGGITWTSAKSTARLTTAEATYILGGSGDTWGHAWTVSQLGNTSFRVRLIDVATSTARDFSLDWVAVKVTYQ